MGYSYFFFRVPQEMMKSLGVTVEHQVQSWLANEFKVVKFVVAKSACTVRFISSVIGFLSCVNFYHLLLSSLLLLLLMAWWCESCPPVTLSHILMSESLGL